MCWSFRVSLFAGIISYCCVYILWTRNRTARDRWNAIFLGVFSTMQFVEAGLWYLHDFRGEELRTPCSKLAETINVIGMCVIILEPVACLLGSMYARSQWWTTKEFLFYVILNFGFQFFFGYIAPFLYDTTSAFCDSSKGCCPYLTENGHLLLAFAVDKEGGPKCWRKYGFFGQPQAEIPFWLRLAYLLGMIYPYMRYSRPVGSGIVQSFVLTFTWMIGYFSDSHASVWCLANVMQVTTMLMDPFWFPPIPQPLSSPIKHGAGGNVRDLYNKRKAQKSFDVIIVGSGIGGLSSAAVLSRAGLKCLVLEAHYKAGGCTHEFRIGKEDNSFDTGIHYIGGSTFIRTMLSLICDPPGVALARMGNKSDNYCYDEFDLGTGSIVRYSAGKESLRKELISHFPHETAGINKFFERAAEAQLALGWLSIIQMLPDWLLDNFPSLRSYLFRKLQAGTQYTAADVVNDCVKDPQLRALLSAGQLIDWNLQPNKASWAVVGAMSAYYVDGGFYPVGGSKRIAEHIIPSIERAGGRVLCRAKVSEIIIDQEPGPSCGHATGVRLTNGDEIYASKGVISDMGILNTLRHIPTEILEKVGLSSNLPSLAELSNGHMTAFVSLDAPADKFDLRSSNIHSWLALKDIQFDPSLMQEAFYKDPFSQKEGCLMTITAPCAKDPEYVVNHPGSSNVLLLTEAKWEWFKDMDLQEVREYYDGAAAASLDGAHGKRPKAYIEFKEKWKELFLDRLYYYYPKTKGHVTSIEIGTPITEAHFLSAPKGASYGLAWTPQRFSETVLRDYMRVKSQKIPGLYIAGESALFGGFAGAMAGGFLAAYKLLGFSAFVRTILKTDLVDADHEHFRKNHPEIQFMEESTKASILSAFLAVIGFMLGGKRLGKFLIKKHL